MAQDKDNSFKPKLGRIGDAGKKSAQSYISRVMREATQLKSDNGRIGSGNSFSGRNVGRGYYANTIRNSNTKVRIGHRRVMIKARIVKLVGAGIKKANTHIKYLQRDGVTKEGEAGKLYDAELDAVNGQDFLNDAKDDRHQFRFIVSPEDAAELDDLKSYTRDLMHQMEKDLDTKLDWVAVDHYNTDNPHTHIIVRGVDDSGGDLIIARDYMSSGFRSRAEDLITDELGPRHEHEIASALRQEVSRDRFTSIDRKLIKISDGGIIDMRGKPRSGYEKFNQSLQVGRLEKLQEMNLARQIKTGVWELSENLEPTLRELGTRGDIIKTMHQEMKRQGRDPLEVGYDIHQTDMPKAITGKLIGKGFADEGKDKYYLVIEGIDGKTHYADIKQSDNIEDYKAGSIIELSPQSIEPRKSDHTIANVSYKNGGIYSAEVHSYDDSSASPEFIQSHVRRLESLRRANIVQRYGDGSWDVPDNYMDRVSEYQKLQAKKSPLNVIIRSQFSLDVQVTSSGATWLDKNLVGKEKFAMSNVGFGGEVEAALKRRQAYLVTQGFAQETENGIIFQRNLLKKLEQQEITKVSARISSDMGKQFVQVKKGDQVEGIYTKSVELASGRFAIIEQSKEFNLVPWRSVLERSSNQLVTGKVGGSGISWQIGKRRGIGVS